MGNKKIKTRLILCSLPPDSPCKLDVLGHDCDPLGMNGTQVGVLKQANKVRLARFLKSTDGRTLKPQVSLEVLRDFPDQALKRQLADQQLGRLLVPPDLPQSNSSRPVSVRFLDSPGGGRTLPGSFGGQLLPGRFATSGLASSLLGTSHGLPNKDATNYSKKSSQSVSAGGKI